MKTASNVDILVNKSFLNIIFSLILLRFRFTLLHIPLLSQIKIFTFDFSIPHRESVIPARFLRESLAETDKIPALKIAGMTG